MSQAPPAMGPFPLAPPTHPGPAGAGATGALDPGALDPRSAGRAGIKITPRPCGTCSPAAALYSSATAAMFGHLQGFPGHLDNLVGGGRHCRSNRRNLNGDAHGQALRLEDRCQSGQGRKKSRCGFRTAVVDGNSGVCSTC